jgi:hypothetical protein
MRSFSSGLRGNSLIDAFRDVPAELRSLVSHLVTDKIYWRVEGSGKSYNLSSSITLHAEEQAGEFHVTFNQNNTPMHKTIIKKWPDNWVDEEIGRDKMKM